MGFFQGLATGLAEGSTTAINKDMTRRQKQIDATMNRIADRRERQLEKADVHDESVKEYYEEIANEFDGDNVAALAAYNAMGGTLSSVKLIMDDYRQTKISFPNSMSLSERLGQDGITYDKAKFGNISSDDALESLYKDVPTTEASDVQYQDTGLLSRLGLGKKDAGKSIAAQVNALIPGREAGEDYNISGATFDRTGMLGARLAEQNFAPKNLDGIEAGLYSDFTKAPDGPEKEALRLELDRLKKYRDEGNNNFTSTELYRGYSTVLSNFNQKIEDMTEVLAGVPTMTIEGVEYSAKDGTYAPKVAELKVEEFKPWVGRTLVGSDASVTSEAQNFINNFDFGDIANEFVTERSKQPEGGVVEGGGATVLTEVQKEIQFMQGDPVAHIIKELATLGESATRADTESVLQRMQRADVYEGMTTLQAIEYDRQIAAYKEDNPPEKVVEAVTPLTQDSLSELINNMQPETTESLNKIREDVESLSGFSSMTGGTIEQKQDRFNTRLNKTAKEQVDKELIAKGYSLNKISLKVRKELYSIRYNELGTQLQKDKVDAAKKDKELYGNV